MGFHNTSGVGYETFIEPIYEWVVNSFIFGDTTTNIKWRLGDMVDIEVIDGYPIINILNKNVTIKTNEYSLKYKIGKVSGSLTIQGDNMINTDNFPDEVMGIFSCYLPKLKNFTNFPKLVNNSIYLYNINKLESLYTNNHVCVNGTLHIDVGSNMKWLKPIDYDKDENIPVPRELSADKIELRGVSQNQLIKKLIEGSIDWSEGIYCKEGMEINILDREYTINFK